MKPGRNDACPCGSGKKYKYCCLSESATVADLDEQTWRHVRAAIDGYAGDVLHFISKCYGVDAIQQGWFEFTMGKSKEFVQGDPNAELFFSWLFHVWSPQKLKGNVISDATLYGVPPSRAYLERRSGRLASTGATLSLRPASSHPLASMRSANANLGWALPTRDVLTGAELNVRELSASAMLARGYEILGQIVALSGIAMVEALAPFSFPPSYKIHLIQVRTRPELEHSSDLALRTLYFSLADAYLNPPPPRLHNTDGDPIEPRTLYFEIDSAQAAFDALSSLTLGSTREELLAEAKFSAKGAVIEAQVPWIRRNDPKHDLETVVLGQLHIADGKLKVEVNSAARASAFRKLLEKTSGFKARYLRTRKHPIDVTRPVGLPGAGAGFTPRNAEQEELLNQPEVRAQLEQLQRRHYENWPEVALPALNNRTPLEAVRNADGREMVEALIAQFERDSSRMPVPPDSTVFTNLRRRLGL